MKQVLGKLLFFRNKLIITSIACILIPALLSLTLYNYLTKDAVKQQAADNAQHSLQLVEGHVSNTLKNMLYIANFIQIDSEMNSVFKRRATSLPDPHELDYIEFSETKRIIDKIDNISIIGEKVHVTILLPNGVFYANYPMHDHDPRSIFQANWFDRVQQLSGLQSIWIGADYEHGDPDQRAITLARTLRYTGAEVIGYVFVNINQEQVSSIFDRVAAGQEILLLDEQGVVISHHDPARIGESFTLHRTSAADEPIQIITMDGADYLVSTLDLGAVAGWQLVMLTPYKQAISSINRNYNVVLMLQLISFFVFLLILIFLLERFTRPLVRLSRLAETVQRGNLEVRSYIKGDDEIGRLGSSFDQMLDRIKQMLREVNLKHQQKRQAEFAMLQAQIHPHFMLNVINSIRMKVMRNGDQGSAEMLSSLSRFLRMSIGSTDDDISLYEEVELVIDYVKLMNLRQKEKVELSLQIESDTFHVEVPRFGLQPLIENALLHGLHQRAGKITIAANKLDDGVLLMVKDNGQGIPAEKLTALQHRLAANIESEMEAKRADGESGVDGGAIAIGRMESQDGEASEGVGLGLNNVKERMQIKFGRSFSMRIDSKYGLGTRVELWIPHTRGQENDVQSDDG